MAAALVPAAALPFDNSSVWHNFTAWTVQHLPFLNMTRIAPSLDGIVWAGPRMVMKLGRLGSFISLPDAVDGLGLGQHVIPGATDAAGNILYGVNSVPSSDAFATAAGAAAAAAAAAGVGADAVAADQDFATALAASASRFSLESARGLGSLFNYATSKWALCCIATAVILNRTYIFAATRRRVRLRWPIRFILRSVPIVLFLLQARRILQSIQCQTSPDFAELRWGNASKQSDLMFSETSVFLHSLSSHLLLNPTDEASCLAIRMIPADRYSPMSELRGSLSLLWPLFVTFCISSFVETLSCAIQGRPVAAETGMTVFEHSLAFAEADAAISNQLGWGAFASVPVSTASASSSTSTTLAAVLAAATRAGFSGGSGGLGGSGSLGSAAVASGRAAILSRVNTPPEVLLLAFLSAMSHITSHILGILNLQSRFRLVSTGFWALCFMGSIVWSAMTFSLDDPSGQSLLRFPTVSIVGFIPHMLVLAGIFVCCFIYCLALLLTAVSQEPDIFGAGRDRVSFRERIAQAHANMQANLPMGNVRVSMEMDFYTALLRAGFDAITMASEAVYLNEDRRVNLRPHTWLEDERYRELQELRSRWLGSDLPGSRFDAVGATGLVPVSGGKPGQYSTGYSRERATQNASTGKPGERIRPIRSGIGASERSGRWLMAVEYLIHVSKLVLTFTAVYAFRVLGFIGIRSQPRWLQQLVQRRKAGRAAGEDGPSNDETHPDEDGLGHEWFHGRAGGVPIQRRGQIDVEQEVRRRYAASKNLFSTVQKDEQEIDNKLYKWFIEGGWWGEVDTSGDYEPSVAPDDDVSSVISLFDMDDSSEAEWEDEAESSHSHDHEEDDFLDDGQRTPTQQSPWITRESTPTHDMSMPAADLARLLDPQSPEERAEAQALAAHLNSDGILTRSAFARFRQRQRAEVLFSSRYTGGAAGGRLAQNFRPNARLTPDEEAQLLEQILLSRRAAMRPSYDEDVDGSDSSAPAAAGSSWATGAAGLGPDGPQCVVCQSAPRTIIVWPCRCLSLCDDCRVSLAMNNFDKCVCCRREVVSFSRIYVP